MTITTTARIPDVRKIIGSESNSSPGMYGLPSVVVVVETVVTGTSEPTIYEKVSETAQFPAQS